MKSHTTRWLPSITLLACAAGLHAQLTYTNLTMIDPGGSQSSRASAINASGQTLVEDGNGNLFLWSAGTSTQVTTNLGAGSIFSPFSGALNDSGQVLGYVEDGEDYRYFIWSSGGGTTEVTPGSFIWEVNGLNNAGQVVGLLSGEPDHGFVWSSGGGTTQLASPHGNTTYANAINNSGQVAGRTTDENFNTVAVRWAPDGSVSDTLVLGMGYVAAINDAGVVAGGLVDSETFTETAYFWDGETMTTVDALPGDDEGVSANAINTFGDIVGTSEGAGERAYLYTDGDMYDLNALVAGFLVENGGDTAGFVTLWNAFGINDAGQIVGQGLYYDGFGSTYSAAFFLDSLAAVPEPSAVAALTGLGALGIAACRRRQLR